MKSRSYTVLVALLLCPGVLLAAEEPPPQFQDSWASCGDNPCYPIGMAADGSGNLYVVDLWNNVVQKFNPNGSSGGSWGIEGTEPGELNGAFVNRDASTFPLFSSVVKARSELNPRAPSRRSSYTTT